MPIFEFAIVLNPKPTYRKETVSDNQNYDVMTIIMMPHVNLCLMSKILTGRLAHNVVLSYLKWMKG